MNILKIFSVFNIVFANEIKNYPTRRWLQICKSSYNTSWYYNKSINMSKFLKNNLDTLYI